MSRFFKDIVKNANKLYYGDNKAVAVGKKIENFADYLGDKNYRDEDLNPSQPQTKNTAQQNNRREREPEREPEINDEPEVIEREAPPQKASIPFMVRPDWIYVNIHFLNR